MSTSRRATNQGWRSAHNTKFRVLHVSLFGECHHQVGACAYLSAPVGLGNKLSLVASIDYTVLVFQDMSLHWLTNDFLPKESFEYLFFMRTGFVWD